MCPVRDATLIVPQRRGTPRPARRRALWGGRPLAALGLLSVLASSPAPALQSTRGWRDAVAAYVAPYVHMNDFSGTILLLRPGKDSLVSAFGVADRASGRNTTPDTRYGIGSLTKTFTAGAIAMLRERGKLSLDDTLGTFIPGFPHGGRSRSKNCSLTRPVSRTTTPSPTIVPPARAQPRSRSLPRGSAPNPWSFAPVREAPTAARGTRCSPTWSSASRACRTPISCVAMCLNRSG